MDQIQTKKTRKPRSCGPCRCQYIYKKTGLACNRTCYRDLCSRHTKERIDKTREKGLRHYYMSQLKKLEMEIDEDFCERQPTNKEDDPCISAGHQEETAGEDVINEVSNELYELTLKLQANIDLQQEIIDYIKARI